MVELPGMSAVFGLPISAAASLATRVRLGVMVRISRVVLETHLSALVVVVVVLQELSRIAATASQARRLSCISALAGAIGGGLSVLGGDGAVGSSLEEVSDRTICCLRG